MLIQTHFVGLLIFSCRVPSCVFAHLYVSAVFGSFLPLSGFCVSLWQFFSLFVIFQFEALLSFRFYFVSCVSLSCGPLEVCLWQLSSVVVIMLLFVGH